MKWYRRNLVAQQHQLDFNEDPLPAEIRNMTEPIQFVQLYLTDKFLEDITFQSNLYAQQKGKTHINISVNELRRYLSVLLFTSIISMRKVRLYWNNVVGVPCIRQALPQRKFEIVRSCLHFNDDSKIIEDKNDPNYDRLHKIRPFLDHFNQVSASIPCPRDLSVDENICATKIHSRLKQYNPKKPHKWGFKVFMLCGIDGFIYNSELYSGQENEPRFRRQNEPDIGASSNVVIRMVRTVPRNRNHRIYFDNWFSSVPLVHHLATQGIHSLGTIRRVRIPNDSLPREAVLKKKKRGSVFERLGLYRKIPMSTVLWKDNKTVTLISSYVGKLPVAKVRRFCRKQRRYLELPCPAIIGEYNRFMGGVDLMGSHIGRGRIKMKSRKWPCRIFYHYLDLMVINAWLLYKRVIRVPMNLQSFRVQVALCLAKIGTLGVSPNKKGRPTAASRKKEKRISSVPPKPVRTDQVGHLPEYTSSTRQRCKHEILERGVMKTCNRLTNAKCAKCNTYLCLTVHRNCFLDFHTA